MIYMCAVSSVIMIYMCAVSSVIMIYMCAVSSVIMIYEYRCTVLNSSMEMGSLCLGVY